MLQGAVQKAREELQLLQCFYHILIILELREKSPLRLIPKSFQEQQLFTIKNIGLNKSLVFASILFDKHDQILYRQQLPTFH